MVYDVKPLPGKTYKFKQSEFTDVPGPLPLTLLITAPSGSGKSIILQRMIESIYAGCFEAGVHIWSQSIDLDDNVWGPVKKYLEKQGFPPEKYCHDKYDEALLKSIMDEQKSVIDYQKKRAKTKKAQFNFSGNFMFSMIFWMTNG